MYYGFVMDYTKKVEEVTQAPKNLGMNIDESLMNVLNNSYSLTMIWVCSKRKCFGCGRAIIGLVHGDVTLTLFFVMRWVI